jgi:hypothetical protein
MPHSVRLRLSLELVDERGSTIIQAPSETFVQGSRLGNFEAVLASGHSVPLDADSTMVAQTAFNLCRDSYKRLATALMNKGEAV